MSEYTEKINQFVIDLYKIKGIKFGQFVLKSGITSPIYFDLRVIVSYPEIMVQLSQLITQLIQNTNLHADTICGVPYTALPIATLVSSTTKIPMVVRRKEQKSYGTAKRVEGEFTTGQSCVIIEDVISTGSSIMETAKDLEKAGLAVKDAIVVLEREQGAVGNLKAAGITTHTLLTLSELLEVLKQAGLITAQVVKDVKEFVASLRDKETKPLNGEHGPPSRRKIPFAQRAKNLTAVPSKTPVAILDELFIRPGESPNYELLQIDGPKHEPTYHFRVSVVDFIGLGNGRSKKDAKHAAAKNVLDTIVAKEVGRETGEIKSPIDYIGALQEHCMSRGWVIPKYFFNTEEGLSHERALPHERAFSINCTVSTYKETGTAKSKKLAKQRAAEKMCETLWCISDNGNEDILSFTLKKRQAGQSREFL